MKEAGFYRHGADNTVECALCSHRCHIKPNKTGICGVRQNLGGTLWSLVYGRVIAQNVDPIEKKPLYHFHPGSRSYSIATVGCNFRCLFCQNADISQAPRESHQVFGHEVAAEDIVRQAQMRRCASISYTYTEPTIFMEYALDVAQLAHAAAVQNVFVSNGYMTGEALEALAPHLDAANVDLKAFNDDFYRKQCGAHLEPVLATLREMKRLGIWLEVTTLIIPGLNDDPRELRALAQFLLSLGPETPWHISRFHPTYRMTDRPVTPVKTLHLARQIGVEEGLQHVYVGNVPGDTGENTYCHACGALLLERFGFSVAVRGLGEAKCTHCGARLGGVAIP
jgi:pyruvate formate lyase activating enzyme